MKKYFSIPKGRDHTYDYLRVFSCLLVILFHASGNAPGLGGEFLRTISPIGMPMFVFMSGALILNDPGTEKIGTFYWKRFVAVVVPFLLYGIVYTGWINQGRTIPGEISLEAVGTAIRMAPQSFLLSIQSEQYVHLWFVYAITGLYLIAPWLRKGLKNLGEKFSIGLAFLIFFMMVVKCYLPILHFQIGITNYITDWLLYFLLGYLLTQEYARRIYKRFARAFFVVFLMILLWRYQMSDITGEHFADLAPHMMLLVVGLFALFSLIGEHQKPKALAPLDWIVYRLSKYCFSIYMIHVPILNAYSSLIHPGICDTAAGCLRAVLVVFLWSFLFALIFDQLITFNVQRLLRWIWKKCHKKSSPQ